MRDCFQVKASDKAVPVRFFTKESFSHWIAKLGTFAAHWAKTTGFTAATGTVRLVPDKNGHLSEVWCGIDAGLDAFWQAGQLPLTLPEGGYRFCFEGLSEVPDVLMQQRFALAFGLGSYQFNRYRKSPRKPARLQLKAAEANAVSDLLDALFFVRDLINLPTDDMGPSELSAEVAHLAKKFHAHLDETVGEDLLKKGFAGIHTVGRASDDPPRLLDLRWGKKNHPKLTLVGKGVCFDSGGLDIKPASAMQLMKKDMGGAALVLGLAQMIMATKLPVRLRVLIPAVENAISGGAYRPGDVITMHSGKTVEVGNTDAEGRLVLADALSEAVGESPDLLIDIATLTGAARVAVGTEISAFFCEQQNLIQALMAAGEQESDPLWPLPLYAPYLDAIKSPVADLNNSASDGYAGAITAALFLREFVPKDIPWVHFDVMAWNTRSRPGRPVGGEAMGIRALFAYLCGRFLVG